MQVIKILFGLVALGVVTWNVIVTVFFFSMTKGEKEKFKKPPKKWWMFWRKR